MKREKLVHLTIERSGAELLISSVEFPLLNVIIDDEEELPSRVLPVLREMIAHEMKTGVELRMVESILPDRHEHTPPPHVIAEMAA